MAVRAFLVLVIIASTAVCAQERVPQRTRVPGMSYPEAGAGLPWPAGLGKKDVLTGHIAAIDRDQMMVRSLDLGEILFWIDERTEVRVDKFKLALVDLRIGDPVAVRLKKVKDRGPYAAEILAHPDVRQRKMRGDAAPPPAAAEASMHGAIEVAPAGAAAAPAVAEPEEPAFPELPAGAAGVVGTVTTATNEELEVTGRDNQKHKVLVTSLTLMKPARPSPGDRIAVTGDRLDGGEWIANQIVVQSSKLKVQSSAAAGDIEKTKDGFATLTGTLVGITADEVNVRTARGERSILITGGTEIRRMGTRVTPVSLRAGDEVSITGDALEGGIMVAREITVTKLASAR